MPDASVPNELPRTPIAMRPSDTALLLVDVQERLLAVEPDRERIVWNCRRLLDAANIVGIRTAGTEQNPEKLGPTASALTERLPDKPFAKFAFSCREWGEKLIQWRNEGIERILLAGIETHVCVQQTALDLVAYGFQVFVAVDAAGSRRQADHEIALRRMEAGGVLLTTTESAMFEWCDRAGTPQFKAISALAKEETC